MVYFKVDNNMGDIREYMTLQGRQFITSQLKS